MAQKAQRFNHLQEFEHELFRAPDLEVANQLLTQYFTNLDIRAFAFTFYTRHPSSVNKIKYDYASKPAKNWHDYYIEQKYNDFDQTVSELHSTCLPLCWDLEEQLRLAKSETERVIRQESIEFGIDQGVSIPMFGPHGHYASFVFYQMKGESWLQDYLMIKYELIIISNLYFNFVMQHLHLMKTSKAQSDVSIQLTSREQECLALTAQNCSAKQVADRLSVTKRTAEFHLNNMNKKLGVNNKFQAVNKALELGLVDI